MKTPDQITELNYNDLAFFNNIKTTDAKWLMAPVFFGRESILEDNLTATGIPKLTLNDLVDKSEFETQIVSNSILDGENNIDHHIKVYNKGVPIQKLREYSEHKPYKKALKFTGKLSILNDILNDDQYLKLQKSWLLANVYMKNLWSEKTVEFIKDTPWALDFLKNQGIDLSLYDVNVKRFMV